MTAKVAFDMVFILGPGESWVVFEVRREGSLGGYTTCCTFSSLARANHEKEKKEQPVTSHKSDRPEMDQSQPRVAQSARLKTGRYLEISAVTKAVSASSVNWQSHEPITKSHGLSKWPSDIKWIIIKWLVIGHWSSE
jgi:hypothetical protein